MASARSVCRSLHADATTRATWRAAPTPIRGMVIHQLPPLALQESTRSPTDAIPCSFNRLATRGLNHMPTPWPACGRQCLNPTLPRRAPSLVLREKEAARLWRPARAARRHVMRGSVYMCKPAFGRVRVIDWHRLALRKRGGIFRVESAT